jgi:hypothetical protein
MRTIKKGKTAMKLKNKTELRKQLTNILLGQRTTAENNYLSADYHGGWSIVNQPEASPVLIQLKKLHILFPIRNGAENSKTITKIINKIEVYLWLTSDSSAERLTSIEL